MENQTRFDLNAAMENWRHELAAQPPLAPDNRRELETHLRDALAELKARGLNDEESFWLARRRVGQPPELAKEFVKADPAKVWRERVFWIILVLSLLQFWDVAFPSIQQYVWKNFEWPAALFYEKIAYYLPVFCFVFFLTRKERWFERMFQFAFRSRLQFILVAVMLVLAFDNYSNFNTHWWTTNWFTMYWMDLLLHQMWSFTLIGLIAWLMPTQNLKTPKHA